VRLSNQNQAFDIFLQKHNIILTDQEKRVKIYGKSNRDIMTKIFEREFTNEEADPLDLDIKIDL
jgi:hypothetical protein